MATFQDPVLVCVRATASATKPCKNAEECKLITVSVVVGGVATLHHSKLYGSQIADCKMNYLQIMAVRVTEATANGTLRELQPWNVSDINQISILRSGPAPSSVSQ